MLSAALARLLQEWHSALRELPDNPLRLHLGTARLRAIARIPRLRRLLLPLLILAGYSLIYMISAWFALAFSSPGAVDYLLYSVYYLLGLGGMYWIVLLCQGVFDMSSDCLSLLARGQRSAGQLSLDESLASSQIGSKDILAGALAVIALPMLRRVLAGALVFATFVMVITSEGLTTFHGREFAGAILLLPLSMLTFALGGMLALFSFAFCMICLGLNQRSALLSSSASGMHSFAQFLYPLFALPLLLEGGISMPAAWLQIVGLLVVAAGYLLFVWMVLAQSASSIYLRGFWALGTPLFLPLLIFVLLVLGATSAFFFSDFFAMHSIWAFGSMALANPLASLGSLAFGGALSFGVQEFAYPLELLRLGLFFALQSAVLLLSARFAEHAVDKWRQAEE